jgi:WSTF, HB1, Itc1p, MBD9 motif 1
MIKRVSHDRADENPEAKARWFQSLSLEERMTMLCSLVDLALHNNPKLIERKNAQPTQGRVRVLSAT